VLDRAEHRPSTVCVAEQGEHTEGLLGGECDVEAHPHGWRPSPLEELGEVFAGDEPLVPRAAVSDEVGLSRVLRFD
jgi:hypothetical protein